MFKVGDRVRRKMETFELSLGFWLVKCRNHDKDPKGVYTVSLCENGGICLSEFGSVGFMSENFELALPESVNLDTFM